MFIKQLSIFVQNTSGRLAEISDIISSSGIDIRALCLADTTNFGILRIIVDKPDEAKKILRDNDLIVKSTSVIAMEINDTPGEFTKALKALGESNISIEYSYAFISNVSGKARVILRVDDNDKAAETLKIHGIHLLTEEDVYRIN